MNINFQLIILKIISIIIIIITNQVAVLSKNHFYFMNIIF